MVDAVSYYLEDKPKFGGLADTEFMVEAGRFGNTSAPLQMGLNWWWDTKGERTQIFDTGEEFDTQPWDRRGQTWGAGRLPNKFFKNTGDAWAQSAGYEDGADWFKKQKAKGNIREGLTFEEWEKDMLELGKEEALAMYVQGANPLQPETWSHELGHIGQYLLRKIGIKSGIDPQEWKESGVTGSSNEELQRVRDLMMSSPGDPAYKDARHWLKHVKNVPYTKDEIKEIAGHVLLEDKYANQVLESQGGIAKSSGDLSQKLKGFN